MRANDDWVIARDGGIWLIGRPKAHGLLSPVFELTCQVQPQPGGRGVMINYGAQPLLLLASLDSWKLSDSVNTWPVKGSSCEMQLREVVKRAEAMVQQMRAQQAGLVVASEMPKGRVQ